MKKITYLLFFIIGLHAFGQGVPIITMIADGDESGGVPKVVEIYAKGTVDFSNYIFEKAPNGGDWTDNFDLSVIGTKTDEFVYIYKDGEIDGISAFDANFPSVPDTNKFSTNSDALSFNGDDPVRIVDVDGNVIDMYGEDGVDGTGTVWEYTDGYSKRLNGTGPDGATFIAASWEFHKGALDGLGAIQTKDPDTGDLGTPYESIIGIGTYTPTTDATPTQLLVTADPTVTYDGQTTLTIIAADDNGTPVNVNVDVNVDITVNAGGNYSPTSTVIVAGSSTKVVNVTYDGTGIVTFTVTADVDGDGTAETATVDVEFKEALIDSFPYTKDFEDGSLESDGWTTYSTSDINWTIGSYNDNYYARFSNYDGGNKPATKAYYISPRIDASSLIAPVLLFDYASKYDADQVPLTVYYSTDYSGDAAAATWNELWSSNEVTDYEWKPSGTLDLNTTDPANIYIAFVVDAPDGVSPTWQIDNILLADKSDIEPSIAITSPEDGTIFSPEVTEVTIEFTVINFEVADPQSGTGDGYIVYTVDAGTPQDKYDITPIVLTGLAAGEHQVVMELVDMNGDPLDPAVSAQVSFTIAAYNEVSTLADLRAGTLGDYYHYTGEASILGGSGALNKLIAFFQDNTAGIAIYDANDVVEIDTAAVENYDVYTDLKGKLTEYAGMLELIPTTDPTFTGNNVPITPQIITAQELNDNHEEYESELIKIENATIDNAGDTAFVLLKKYDLTDDTGVVTLYTLMDDIEGVTIPTSTVNVTGIGGEYNGTAQIYPRDADDFEEASAAVGQNDIQGLTIYPNPVDNGIIRITSDNAAAKQVIIYNITGKQIYNNEVENGQEISVNNLKSGVYLIKVIENDKIAVQKLMVK